MSKNANQCRGIRRASSLAILLGGWLCLHPGTANCEQNPSRTSDAELDARKVFEKAIELSDQGAYSDALLLFQRAYSASPRFAVLYNIAQIHAVLGQDLLAIQAYRRYLDEAGNAISTTRRNEVEATVVRLEMRLGLIDVRSSPPASHVLVDGVDAGQAPLQLRVASGSHMVTVIARGYQWKSQKVDLRRGEVVHVSLALDAETASASPPKAAATLPSNVQPALAVKSIRLKPVPVRHLESDTRLWGYLLAGTSLALAAGSVTFAVWAQREANEYREQQVELNGACYAGQFNTQLVAAQQENNRQLDKVHRLDLVTAGLAVGAAATIVGAITWYVQHNRPNPRNWAASLQTPRPLTWRFTF